MEPESVISLFDSLWYDHEFFKKHPNPPSPSRSDPNPDRKIQEIVTDSRTREIMSSKKQSRREVAKKGRARCKSLSELEFEELKGFKDLGFEFSEEDANSSLVYIIPGLMMKTENCRRYCGKSRPYLSDAWEAMEKDKKKKALMKWKIPAMSNEVKMKRNLRRWAHTVVASTV